CSGNRRRVLKIAFCSPMGPYDRMFYVFHSGEANTDDDRVTVIGTREACWPGGDDWVAYSHGGSRRFNMCAPYICATASISCSESNVCLSDGIGERVGASSDPWIVLG